MAETSTVVSMDSVGRIVLPKFLRKLLKTNKFVVVFEDNEVRLKPILSWDEAFGSMKNLDLKKFRVQHEADLE